MSRKDEDIRETRLIVATRAGFMCETCGKAVGIGAGQLAHVIPQRKHLIAKYGEGVIHHPDNMRWTCPTDLCNNAVSLGEKSAEIARHAREIREAIYLDMARRVEASPERYTNLVTALARVASGATT